MSTAYFDLDGTLLVTNGSFHFGRFLCRQGVFSKRTLLRMGGYYLLHKAAAMSLQTLHHKSFSCWCKGRPLELFTRYAEIFVDQVFDALAYTPALERLEEHRRQGHRLMLLSNSPDFLVGPFARRLGIENYLGSHYSVDNAGVLCTISNLIVGEDKAKIVRSNCRSGALTYGYSDSHLDLPFLEAVDVPTLVRPDRRLAAIGRKRNWNQL